MFDMDGTLLDLQFDNYFFLELIPETYAEINSISKEESLSIVKKLYQEVQGTLKWYSIDYWTEQLKIDIPSLKRSVVSKISIRPNVEIILVKTAKTQQTAFASDKCAPKNFKYQGGATYRNI